MQPVPVEACVGARDITEPRLSADGSTLVYASSEPGRTELVLHTLDVHGRPIGEARRLSSEPAPRVGRGFGGGCWCWSADGRSVVYAAADGDLWWQPLDGVPPRRLTSVGEEGRAAQAPAATADGRFVVFVVDQAEVWSVALDDLRCERLDDGTADFCSDPSASPDGRCVVWVEWDVPDMPWDGARIAVMTLADRSIERRRPVGSIQQPRWSTDGRLHAVRDGTGWLNVCADDAPVVAEAAEHAGPSWGQGQRSYAVSPDGSRVAFTRNEAGFGRLCIVDRADGSISDVGRGVHGQLSWSANLIAALRSGARTPTEVVVYDLAADPPVRSTVVVAPAHPWDREQLVEPSLMEVPTADGAVVPCRWYPAAPDADGAHRAPRAICWIHGGPTDQWQVTFLPRLEYFRSRGWDIVVPDHRGSTGHGRAFQQSLNGHWGEFDVDDVAAVLEHLGRSGRIDPRRTVLMGGSAGGFTVLGVLARYPGSVRAAAVSYPVADLVDLEQRSHRFERHSVWRLVARPGASVDGDRLLHDRSPVHLADRITVPLAVAHGSDDPVVPVEQSETLARRITAAGGQVDLVVYAGEGHGLRQPANQADDLLRVEAFLDLHVPAEADQG